ncbi:glutathione gamma-glutamylcysteinyltransferase [Aureococcus anophagefferens]|nr:glutathione gamma-glutamylcysteinyltransferase [Aureococcus anophagefferens]
MAAGFLAFTLFLGRGHALDASPYADYFLPTPTIATPLNTTAGFDILLKPTTLRRSYVALAPHFATQSTQSYCAVASSVMALNALPAVAAPVDGAYAPYAYWTQGVLATSTKRAAATGRLAAYDADGDLALLLDVARRAPAVWVPPRTSPRPVAGDADNAGGAPRGVLVLEAT